MHESNQRALCTLIVPCSVVGIAKCHSGYSIHYCLVPKVYMIFEGLGNDLALEKLHCFSSMKNKN